MIFQTKIWTLLVLISSLLIISCGKDETISIDLPTDPPAPGINIFSTISGLVLDQGNQILEGAEIYIGDNQVKSDQNGFFTSTDFFPSDGTLLKVNYPGYRSAIATLLPLADETLTLNVVLQREGNESRNAADQNTINVAAAQVAFAAAAYTELDGSAYTGEVRFRSSYVDPTSEEDSNVELGPLLTDDPVDGRRKLIQSYGMVSISLEGLSGQELQISSPATITMRVPETLMDNAPAQVPLLYRDTQSGLWVEEGFATLENGNYVGEVSHFTDWLCGPYWDYLAIYGVISRDGSPYERGFIKTNIDDIFSSPSSPGFNGSYHSTSSIGSNGVYRKLIPDVGEPFNIRVFDRCNVELYEELNIAPLTEDREHNFEVSPTTPDISVSGTVYCTDINNTVDGVYILISVGGIISTVWNEVELGEYGFSIPNCGSPEITIMAFDPVTLMSSETVVVSGQNNLVHLNVCEEAFTGSMTMKLEGEDDYVISGCDFSIDTIRVSGGMDKDSLLMERYIFRSTDRFESHPQGLNQEAFYEIIYPTQILPSPSEPNPVFPPLGPPLRPVATPDAPFYFECIPSDYNLISEDETHIVLEMLTQRNGNNSFYRIENGVETQVIGTVLIQDLK